MPNQNVQQVSDWNGPSGERWVANQARLDAMLAVFGDAAIAAAAPTPGEAVLDVGCGAGASSFALAERVAPGHVVGVDISQALVERARELTPVHAAVSFEVADAAGGALPGEPFDLLFSRFGVMFFDDAVAAFAALRKALRPGGRLAFVCWRGAAENDWIRLPMGAVRGIVPPSPAPDPEAPGPFSFGDAARVQRILSAAGLVDGKMTPFDHAIPFGQGVDRDTATDDAVGMAFAVGPLSRALNGQPQDVRSQAAVKVREAFAARPVSRDAAGGCSVMIDGAAWIVTARNPDG